MTDRPSATGAAHREFFPEPFKPVIFDNAAQHVASRFRKRVTFIEREIVGLRMVSPVKSSDESNCRESSDRKSEILRSDVFSLR